MTAGARKALFFVDALSNDRDVCSPVSPIAKMKRSVTIRPWAVLSAVLDEAGLPEVKYKTCSYSRGRVMATAIFWPSRSHSSAPVPHMRISGDPAVDVNEAIQNEATSCLEHLQATMDIKFDCPRMQKIKTNVSYLSNTVAEQSRKIRNLKAKVEKRDLRVRGIAKGWGSLADDMLGSAGRIDKMAVNYLPTGSSSIVDDVAWDCYHLTQEADNLAYLSVMSTDAVKSLGDYPYDTESDFSECDEFYGYYPFDHEGQDSGYYSSDLEGACGANCLYDEFLNDGSD